MTPDLISFNTVLNLPICKASTCGYAIEVDSVRNHFRKCHKASVADAMQVELDMATKFKSVQENARHGVQAILRTRYLETCTATHTSSAPLPAITDLPVVQCRKCPDCGYIAGKLNTMRKHMSGSSCSSPGLETPVVVKAQSIFGGNKRKYFEVIDNSDPVIGSCSIAKTMRHLQGSNPAADPGNCSSVAQMDAFLATMRFDRQLEACQVSKTEAFRLCDVAESNMRPSIGDVITAYHKLAFDISETKIYIKSHTFMDTALSIALSGNTVERYNSRVCRLLHFVLSCCEDGHPLRTHFPHCFREGVAELKDLICSDPVSGLRQFHSLLYDLFFCPLKDNSDGLVLFISCASVIRSADQQSYRFSTASDLSPVLAALKHFARCAVIVEGYGFNQKDPDAAWERVDKATGPHSDTGIQFVRHCLKVCNRLRESEIYRARFMICPKHELCALLDGVELSLNQLGQKMRLLQDKAGSCLNNLLNGIEITTAFWEAIPEMQDCLSDLTPGYWFGVHAANKHVLEYWSHSLLQSYRHILLNGDNSINVTAAQTFLMQCEELQSLLYTLMQTCSGAPARATELGVLRVCNTDIGVRNIFVNGGQLFTVVSYHKGRSMEEGVGRPVARYPDRVTGGLLSVYLIVVRPLESALVKMLDRHQPLPGANLNCGLSNASTCANSAGTTHRDYLFVSQGKPLTNERLRYLFEKNMKTAGIPFGTNQYRQYHGGVIKNFFGSNESKDPEISAATLHKQSGHSEQTAHQIYGVSSLDMRKLTGTEMEAFRQASKRWHCALGMKHGSPCSATDAVSQCDPGSLTTQKDSFTSNSLGANLKTIIARLTELESTPMILKRMESNIHELSALLKETNVRKRSVLDTDLNEEGEQPAKKARTCSVAELRLKLREFLNQERAEFNSKEQESAVLRSFNAERDCLVVLPTGGGKSLTFLLSAYMLADKVVIIVVPLVSLQKDLVMRCQNAGLQAVQWRSRNEAGVRLVVTSVEHLSSSAYQTYVRELYSTGRLHAIFIDEAHLSLLWLKFRQAIRAMHRYIRPDSVNAPIIALTATAPPSLENHIATACGMSDWSIIRSETSRSNIHYEVRDVAKQQIVREVDSLLCDQYMQFSGPSFRAIVYTQTRVECEMIACALRALSPENPCYNYHAGMSQGDRDDMQRKWMDDSDKRAHVMVATSAFGCGIDVPTVRVVIHAGQPRTLTEYLQESGRAGRDKKSASSIVLNTGRLMATGQSQEDRVPSAGPQMHLDESEAPLRWNENMFGSVDKLCQDSTECRRWQMDGFVDGKTTKMSCNGRGMAVCDVCRRSLPTNLGVSADGRLDASHSFEISGSDTPINSGRESVVSKSPSTASAEEISQGYGSRVDVSLCPVCTVLKRQIVEHKHSSDEKNWLCYRKRCLRCAMLGHSAKKCQMFRLKETSGGCAACGFRSLDGLIIHRKGEYGRSSCRIKKIMCLALLCYENDELRQSMTRALPGLEQVKKADEFSDWLRENPNDLLGESRAGLKFFLPWFFNEILHVYV